MPEYNLNEPVDLVAKQKANNQAFLANQNQLTSDFLNKYAGTISAQGSTQQAAEKIAEEYNLPQLRKTTQDLGAVIEDLPNVQTQAVKGFSVNQNQLQRIIASKLEKLMPEYNRAASNQQFAEKAVGERLQFLNNDWNRALLPLTSEEGFLKDRYARETSMMSESDSRELNAILEKVRLGTSLTMAEQQRAHELALKEKDYENELKKIAETAKYQKTESPYMSVGEKGWLYNTQTGQKISNYGSGNGGGAPLPTVNTPNATTNSSTIPGTFNYWNYVK